MLSTTIAYACLITFGLQSGGAIFANGGLIIENSNFTNNVAIDGGAVFTTVAELNITGSSFINNVASTVGIALVGLLGYVCTGEMVLMEKYPFALFVMI